MKWTVAQARQHFSELLRLSATEPQPIFNRNRAIAALVDMDTFERFQQWRARENARSLGDAFDDLREICKEENYTLRTGARKDRPNDFAEACDVRPRRHKRSE